MMDVNKILNQSTKKPQSVLKIVLGIAVIMLVMWMFLISKMEVSGQTTPAAEGVTQTESIKSSLLQQDDPEKVTVRESESPDMFKKALPTFIIMMVILGGIWIWAKKKGKGTEAQGDVRDIGNYVLGQGSQLKFVEINHEVWVLGLTAGSVNLLHRVPKAEWTDEHTESEISPKDFKSFYNLLKN